MPSVNVVLGAVLFALGELDDTSFEALREYVAPTINNSRGEPVGRMEASSEWRSVTLKEDWLL